MRASSSRATETSCLKPLPRPPLIFVAKRAALPPVRPGPATTGPDLSRGFRALKTWFTIKTYGTEQLGAVIARTCELARYLEQRIAAEPKLELLAPVQLNIVCFRYRSQEADKINAAIVAMCMNRVWRRRQQRSSTAHLAIRAAFVNHRTQTCDIDALIAKVLERGDIRSGLENSEQAKT